MVSQPEVLPSGLLGRETGETRTQNRASDWTAPASVPEADRRGPDMLVEMFNHVRMGFLRTTLLLIAVIH